MQLRAECAAHMDAAEGWKVIAFCCTYVGMLGFSQEEAIGIAVQPERVWLDVHPDVPTAVTLNVFDEIDELLWRRQLGMA